MTPETPDSRQMLEARLTALLLGELSGAEASALRQAIEDDSALAKLYGELSQTIKLVRETAASPSPESGPQPAPLRMSGEKRQKLLAQFKTVKPAEFAKPKGGKLVLSPLMRIAAMVAIFAILASMAVPNLIKSRATAKSTVVMNNLRQLENAKQQWAAEQKAAPDAVPTAEDLKRYLGRSGSDGLPQPVAGEKYNIGKLGESPSAQLADGRRFGVRDDGSVGEIKPGVANTATTVTQNGSESKGKAPAAAGDTTIFVVQGWTGDNTKYAQEVAGRAKGGQSAEFVNGTSNPNLPPKPATTPLAAAPAHMDIVLPSAGGTEGANGTDLAKLDTSTYYRNLDQWGGQNAGVGGGGGGGAGNQNPGFQSADPAWGTKLDRADDKPASGNKFVGRYDFVASPSEPLSLDLAKNQAEFPGRQDKIELPAATPTAQLETINAEGKPKSEEALRHPLLENQNVGAQGGDVVLKWGYQAPQPAPSPAPGGSGGRRGGFGEVANSRSATFNNNGAILLPEKLNEAGVQPVGEPAAVTPPPPSLAAATENESLEKSTAGKSSIFNRHYPMETTPLPSVATPLAAAAPQTPVAQFGGDRTPAPTAAPAVTGTSIGGSQSVEGMPAGTKLVIIDGNPVPVTHGSSQPGAVPQVSGTYFGGINSVDSAQYKLALPGGVSQDAETLGRTAMPAPLGAPAQPPPQLAETPKPKIQAKFAETTPGDSKALGFNWTLGGVNFANGNMIGSGGTQPSLTTRQAQSVSDGVLAGSSNLRNPADAPTLGTVTGIMTNPEFRVAINALQQRDDNSVAGGRVVASGGTQPSVGDATVTLDPDGRRVVVAADDKTMENVARVIRELDHKPADTVPNLGDLPVVGRLYAADGKKEEGEEKSPAIKHVAGTILPGSIDTSAEWDPGTGNAHVEPLRQDQLGASGLTPQSADGENGRIPESFDDVARFQNRGVMQQVQSSTASTAPGFSTLGSKAGKTESDQLATFINHGAITSTNVLTAGVVDADLSKGVIQMQHVPEPSTSAGRRAEMGREDLLGVAELNKKSEERKKAGPSQLTLDQALEEYSKLTGRPVIPAKAMPQVNITFDTHQPLTTNQAIQVLDTALAMNGVTMVNSGDNSVRAVPTSLASAQNVPQVLTKGSSQPVFTASAPSQSSEPELNVEKSWDVEQRNGQLATHPNSFNRTNLVYTSKGRQEILSKLDRIRVDSAEFDNLPLPEVIQKVSELAKQNDPDKTGVNFMIDRQPASVAGATKIDPNTNLPIPAYEGADINSIKVKIDPPLTNVRLGDLLEAITKASEKPIKYSVLDYAVSLSAKNTNEVPLEIRTFKVDPNTFRQGLESISSFPFGDNITTASGGASGGSSVTTLPRVNRAGGGTGTGGIGGIGGGAGGGGIRFVTSSTNSPDEMNALVRQFFIVSGIDFNTNTQSGKTFVYSDRKGVLTVRATAQDLDMIGAAVETLNIAPPQVHLAAKFAEAQAKEKAEAQAKADAERLKKEAEAAQAAKPALNPPKPAASPLIPQPEVSTAENAFSTFSLNVADVAFKLAAASLEKGVMPDPSNIRTEEFINAFDYRDPEPGPGAPLAFAWERVRYPFAQNRDLLRFAVKTAAAGRQPGRPMNIVLLLDNSGSMERADRVAIIRQALRVLASKLEPQDRLSVVTFARTAHLRVDGVPGSQAAQVAEEIGGLTPQGGTNLEEAMRLAYETAQRHYLANGVNRVVLMTDGAANLGNVDPVALKEKVDANRKQGIALDCFGIGWEGYNDDLLETLSRNGDGRYRFINTPEEATTDFVGQLAGALNVAASDVKVQVEFNPKRVANYRQIGYAKHQLTKEQFRDNTVNAAQIAAAESGNALYTVEVNPAGEGPIAIVRVRYRVPGTQDYHEHEWAVPYQGNALGLEQASIAMRLAGAASAFAEWLGGSPFAAEVTPDRLLSYLNGVPEAFGADQRPKKLEWMIRQAKSLTGK